MVYSDLGVFVMFCVFRGNVILFGVMEDVFESSKFVRKFNVFVEKIEVVLLEGGVLDNVCDELWFFVVE